MGLEQYAGMSDEVKLATLLVKVDNIESLIAAKPCPSQECVQYRQRLQSLEEWRTKRMAEIAKEDEIDQDHKAREAWVIPMWVAVGVSAATMVISLFLELWK